MAASTERVRHELKFRLPTVVSNVRITPLMARITLTDPSFAEFPSAAYDDHVKLFIAPVGQQLVMPKPGPNGLEWPEGAPRPEGRDYTPRSFDKARREVVIDFVLHKGGVAAEWAANARPGYTIGMGGPRGSFVVRGTFPWYMLIGDETALPAIGRRIEELPAGSKVFAFVEIVNAAERQSFGGGADVAMTWVERAAGGSIIDIVKAADLPTGDGYVFIAGEHGLSGALREYFVTERGHDPDLIKSAGYWRRGEADFDDGHAH